MRQTLCIVGFVIFCAVSVLAQDSVSPNTGGAWQVGDAPYLFDTGELLNRYIVDTQQVTSSWGTNWRVAPLVKGSRVQTGFTTSLLSAQGISVSQFSGVPFAFGSYEVWNQPGYGTAWEDGFSLQPTTVSAAGLTGQQFAVGFSEFGTGDGGGNLNSVVGAVVNYDPADPYRLYVARINAAVNAQSDTENRSQFGFGSVDSSGHVYFRADAGPGPFPLIDNNLFRVRLVDPDGAGPRVGRDTTKLNVIDVFSNSDAPATDWLLAFDPTVHTCPGNIPQQINGTRPVIMDLRFGTSSVGGDYVREATAGVLTADASHRVSPDHRGQLFFSPRMRCSDPNSVGTAVCIGGPLTSGTPKRTLNLFEIRANGSVIRRVGHTAPQIFTNLPPNNVTFGSLAGNGATFEHYSSQVAFRGGPPATCGEDQQGRQLAAGVMYDSSAFTTLPLQNPYNAIAVARFNCTDPNDAAQWTLAAYICQISNSGTPGTLNDDVWDASVYYTNGGATPAGTLAPLYKIPLEPTSNRNGPSMSAPAMDSVGNIWFIAPYMPYGASNANSGLFRAVYDPATFTYRLDLVLPFGAIIQGVNSATPYRIVNFDIRDSNSVDSATLWAGNVLQTAWADADVSELSPADPRTLGGLVVSARILYDSNGDGQFGNDTGLPIRDQGYNVLLFVGPDLSLSPAVCPGDSDCDGDVDFDDIDLFVAALGGEQAWSNLYQQLYGTLPPCSYDNNDVDGQNGVNFDDIDPFVARIGQICP